MPRIFKPSEEVYAALGKELQDGKLVAFVTETVYGLGANALDGEACKQIFAAKGRPANDPLIVHTVSLADAVEQFDLIDHDFIYNSRNYATVERLSKAFWPGPLTIVVPRNKATVPDSVTAGGNTVGLRVPCHPIARALIAASGRPIAAPSANKFGHVSPTTAQHVYDDFIELNDLSILDGGSSDVGIESTVLRVNPDGSILILRRGKITEFDVLNAIEDPAVKVSCVAVSRSSVLDAHRKLQQQQISKTHIEDKPAGEKQHQSKNDDNDDETLKQPLQAPGMLLTHYAPKGCDTYLLMKAAPEIPGFTLFDENTILEVSKASSVVLLSALYSNDGLDENSLIADLKARFGLNLGSENAVTKIWQQSPKENKEGPEYTAAKNLFATLRKLEEGACEETNTRFVIIIPPPEFFETGKGGGIAASLFDRMFRSASGKIILYK